MKILERDNFSNSESLCCSDASYQVSAQSDLRFGNLRWNGTILAILNFYVVAIPTIKFRLNLTYGLGEISLKNVKMATVAAIF